MVRVAECYAAVILLTVTMVLSHGDQACAQETQKVDKPKLTPPKKRRIIYQDDGGGEKPSHNPDATVAGFLDSHFNAAVGSQVDTWTYNVGNCWLNRDGTLYPWGQKLRQTAGVFGDSNQIIVEAAHKAGMEIFASLKMNDAHCAYVGVREPFKLDRPDLLIGEHFPGKYPHLLKGESPFGVGGYPDKSMVGWQFAGLDFAEPEVQEYRLKFIRLICAKYDWDGIELDFCRAPLFFKPGEEEDNLETMTAFMRKVRRTLDSLGRKRGRPYVLAVRVPPTPRQALLTGLNVEKWLSEGLIEILINSAEHALFNPRLKQFVDLGHRYGVPVYPCISAPMNRDDRSIAVPTIASNFWALGADGIYLFNFPNWGDKKEAAGFLRQIGDPKTLMGLDKRCLPVRRDYAGFLGYSIEPEAFPMRLVHAPRIEIVVGDDVAKASKAGRLKELRLKVDVSNMHEVEGLNLKVNGSKVPADDIRRTTQGSFEAILHAPPVRRGINEIEILPGRGSIGRFSSTVDGIEIRIRYKNR